MSKVFISYRRDDSAGYAHAVYRELLQHFSKDQLFMDVDTVEPGVDFVRVIEEAVGKCDVLVALIGKRWAIPSGDNRSRLDDPNDFVRLEISTALERNIRVIPVLVDGITMPGTETLPDVLKPLSRRNAMEISNTRFDFDLERVTTAVRKTLDDATEAKRAADEEAEIKRIEQEVLSPWRTYGPVGLAVALALILFSFVFWWPKQQEAPVKEAGVQKEAIKEAPIVEPQPPKEIVASAPEKRLEAQKEIISHPPVVKVQPETRSETTPQKKAEGQREIPRQTREREPKQEKLAIQTGRTGESGPSIATADPKKKAIPDYSETRGQIAGRWEGRYQCQGEEIGFSLHITDEDGNHVAAIFEFFPLPETVSFPRGSFRMVGDYNRNDGNLRLQSAAWIQRPLGFQSHNLEGQIEANGTTISGRVLTAGCAHFMLTRK
jgi:hypothetical protein